MYMDDIVIAGIITIAGCVVFVAGIGVFIWNDMHKDK